MVGMLEILAMREEARARLQHDFDLARFHQVVPGNGNPPLKVLREAVSNMGIVEDGMPQVQPPN